MRNRGRVSGLQAALSGSNPKAPGFAGGYLPGPGRQSLSISREAVPNLDQRIRVGADRDGAESCFSKTLQWTAGLRQIAAIP